MSRKPVPVRLKLSRRAGFNLQRLSQATNGLDALVVSRPSRWGNPYTIAEFGREKAIALYEARIRSSPERLTSIALLRGKNLACWCAPDQDCHADILLHIANGPHNAPTLSCKAR